MSEVMEVVEDVKNKLGDKGFLILIGGIVLVFLYNLSKSSSTSDTTSTMVYASYPDSTTNADVIISTLQDNIEYAQNEVLDAITETNKNISYGFEETNGYISSGIASNAELSNKIDAVSGAISSKIDTVSGAISSGFSGVNSAISSVSANIDAQNVTLSAIQSKVEQSNTTSTATLVNDATVNRHDSVSGLTDTSIFNNVVSGQTTASSTNSRSDSNTIVRKSSTSGRSDSHFTSTPSHIFGELSVSTDIKR